MRRRGVIGAFLVIAGVILGIMAGGSARAQQPQALVQNGPPAGRYQIVFSPHVRSDTYLLDTETGRIWMQVKMTGFEGDPIAWDLQDRLDDTDTYTKWVARQKRKTQ